MEWATRSEAVPFRLHIFGQPAAETPVPRGTSPGHLQRVSFDHPSGKQHRYRT